MAANERLERIVIATPPVAALSSGTLATHEKDSIEAALEDSKGR
jgi:hypothetical protein